MNFSHGHVVSIIYIPSDHINPFGFLPIFQGLALIISEVVFTTPGVKPVGPASKTLQLVGGYFYKKFMQKSITE